MPDALIPVADKLTKGTMDEMLARSNSAYVLETLLRRFVYSEPVRLKSTPALRVAVLKILDGLVSAGSPAAYRMRDDFVTPLASE